MSHGHGKVESAGHEGDATSVKAILVCVVAIYVLVGAALVVEAAHMRVLAFLLPDTLAADQADNGPLPGHVKDWAKPGEDLAASRGQWKDRLTSYGWVDQQAGVIHIPIDRAMQLLAPAPAEKPPEVAK